MEIKKAKENKGRGQEGRVDVISELERAFSCEDDVVATISLCLDLLPYYTPDPKVVNFEFGKNNLQEYLDLIHKDFVFVILATFVGILQYEPKPEFRDALRKMVVKFTKAGDVLTLGDDPGFAAIKQAISKWRPLDMPKNFSDYMTARLERVIMVEFAKELDDKFQVLCEMGPLLTFEGQVRRQLSEIPRRAITVLRGLLRVQIFVL